jgi:hypothetical protein
MVNTVFERTAREHAAELFPVLVIKIEIYT